MGGGSLVLGEADELTFCLSVPALILHRLLSLCKPMQVSCSWPPSAPFRVRRDHLAIRGLAAAQCCSTGGNAGFSQCPVDLTLAELSAGVGQ